MRNSIKTLIDKYFKDENGAISALFVIFAPVVLFVAGFAFDYYRASAAQTALQQAVDATVQHAVPLINNCLDQENTTKVGEDTLDTGCFNGVGTIVTQASGDGSTSSSNFNFAPSEVYFQEEVRKNFFQVLYNKNDVKYTSDVGKYYTVDKNGRKIGLPFVSSLSYDKKIGELNISAYVNYNCFLANILITDCRLIASTDNNVSDAFSQADKLVIEDPGDHEIWAEETDSPDLPVQLSAFGGWTPYAFGYEGSLPSGLSMTSEGLISGVPSDVSCAEATCAQQSLPGTKVYVQDSGDQNRGGLNQQTAYSSVGWSLVHKLKIDAADQTIYVGDSFTSSSPNRTGGKPTYWFSWLATTDSAGAMSQTPPGLALTAGTGIISGVATTPSGTPGSNGYPEFTFLEKVVDGRNKTAQDTVKYRVLPKPITISKDNDLYSTGPTFVSAIVRYSGGYGNLSVNCVGLPSGLTCNNITGSTITVSGTPIQPGTGYIDVVVTDEWSQTATATIYFNFIAPPVTITLDSYLKSSDAGTEPVSGTSTTGTVTTTTTVVNPDEGITKDSNTTYIRKYPGTTKSIGTTFHATGGWGTLRLSCDASALTTGAYLNSIYPLSCTDNGLDGSTGTYKGTVSGTLSAYSTAGTLASTYLYINGTTQTRLSDRGGSLYRSSPKFTAKACDSYNTCATTEIYYDFDLYSSTVTTDAGTSSADKCTITGDGNFSSGCTLGNVGQESATTTTGSDGSVGHDTGDPSGSNGGI